MFIYGFVDAAWVRHSTHEAVREQPPGPVVDPQILA